VRERRWARDERAVRGWEARVMEGGRREGGGSGRGETAKISRRYRWRGAFSCQRIIIFQSAHHPIHKCAFFGLCCC